MLPPALSLIREAPRRSFAFMGVVKVCVARSWHLLYMFGFTLVVRRCSLLPFSDSLSGTIPTEVGLISRMIDQLSFMGNRLSGTLPTQIGQLSRISKGLNLNYNQISG